MRKYKVIQWATGVVGTASLKGVLRNPLLELVGVKVHYDGKAGRDAGEIAGTEKTGIKTYLDLPMITGRMGTYSMPR